MKSPGSTIPDFLLKLRGLLLDRLGEDLVGLYAYGSVLDATFDPTRSDVDCIAVTEQPLTDGACRLLADDLARGAAADAWFDRLQLSFLIKDTVVCDDPRACLYQFGELTRSGSDGNPIIWLDYLQRGGVVFGAQAESFLPEISAAMFRQALAREAGYLRERLARDAEGEWRGDPTYPIYATLTLCRILFSAQTGGLASKSGTAAWALAEVPARWHPLIHRARGGVGSEGGEALDLSDLRAFVEYADGELESLPLVSPLPRRRGPLSEALRWIVDLLREQEICYQVVGGLAARAHGATRPLADIDLYVPDSALVSVGRVVEPWLKRGPTPHVDDHWDLTFMMLIRDGWQIEIAGSDSALVWDDRKGRWVSAGIDFAAGELRAVEGVEIRVMPKDQLVAYKEGLGRGVDRMDLEEL